MILRVLFICVGVGACVPWRSFWFQPKPSITDDPAIPDDPATAEPPALEVVLAKTDLVLCLARAGRLG